MFAFDDFCQNGVSIFGPGEDFWGIIVGFQILVDGLNERLNAAEVPHRIALSVMWRNHWYDHVEPGRTGRNKVEVKAFVEFEPALHRRGFVGGVVVHDQVKGEFWRRVLIDGFEKLHKLLGAMTRQAFAEDLAVEHVEGGKECGGAVALVVMGHGGGAALFHGQTRLGAV